MNKHLADKIDSHLEKLAKSKPLEDYCTNCGVCCRPHVTIVKGSNKRIRIVAKELSCKFMEWDGKESKCSTYETRHEKAPWCVDIQKVISQGIAPNDCPYVDTLEGYVGAVDLNEPDYQRVLPVLKEAIANGDHAPIGTEQLRDFLEK